LGNRRRASSIEGGGGGTKRRLMKTKKPRGGGHSGRSQVFEKGRNRPFGRGKKENAWVVERKGPPVLLGKKGKKRLTRQRRGCHMENYAEEDTENHRKTGGQKAPNRGKKTAYSGGKKNEKPPSRGATSQGTENRRGNTKKTGG